MRVTSYASLPHYARHVLPVLELLDVETRRWSPKPGQWWGEHPGRDLGRYRDDDVLLVASYADAQKLRGARLVYVEHGAGQHYPGDRESAGHPSYAGGASRASVFERVELFVVPSETVGDRWRAAWPETPVVVAGCPFLDPWHRGERPVPTRPTVALTFHWDCNLVPETRSALRHFDRALPHLVTFLRSHGVEVIGHGHPRAWGVLARRWAALDVEPVQQWPDVLDRATVLIGDNSSALFEFASLDRPVVVLNAPWYRRDVEHGLRFWSHVPGVQCDEPDDLLRVVEQQLVEPALGEQERRHAVAFAYAHRDGRAAERTAAAIMEASDAEPVHGLRSSGRGRASRAGVAARHPATRRTSEGEQR